MGLDDDNTRLMRRDGLIQAEETPSPGLFPVSYPWRRMMSAKEGSPFEKMNGATEKTREFVENAYSTALQSAASYNAKLLEFAASTMKRLSTTPMSFPA